MNIDELEIGKHYIDKWGYIVCLRKIEIKSHLRLVDVLCYYTDRVGDVGRCWSDDLVRETTDQERKIFLLKGIK